MGLELYWGSGSPFAWRVMLTLEVKGLTYASKLLEFSKGETRTPAYLQLNPRGKVPTLKDGEFVIYESLAIMVYLDRKYPYPPLFGRTAEEAGLIWRAISECESYLAISGDKVVRPILFGKDFDKLDEIRKAMITVHHEFKTLDERLARSTWLVGDQMTAADISVYPLIQLLLRAASKPAAQALDLGLLPLARSYPNIARWAREIEALPGYERTYPPHWR